MFLTQEFCSMLCIALEFVILCYLIKIYRAVLQLEMNNQHEDLTEGRERSNRERINDRADSHIRHATEHDERARGGGTPYNGLYGEAPPERGTFFRPQV